MTPRALLLCAPLVTLALAATGCSPEPPAPEPIRRPVKVREAISRGAGDDLRFAAELRAFAQIPLAFRVTGQVTEIAMRRESEGGSRHAQQGDRVEAGEMLAKIRADDYRRAEEGALARHHEASIAASKSTDDLARAERLHQTGSLTRTELETSQAAHDMAAARLEAAQARLEETRLAVRDSTLRAPRSAVLLERRVEPGQLVSAGTVGFVLADISRVRVVFGVAGDVVSRLEIGSRLPVVIGSGEQELLAPVTSIAPAADPTSRVFEVELTIDNSAGTLRPGTIAAVRIPDASLGESAPVVPLSAIVRPPGGEGYAVFVVVGDAGNQKAQLRPAVLGDIAGNGVEVSEGLTVGEPVVVTGATLLVDGEPVQVIP
jgi:multidrug efflux system membrane fusion protein